MNTWLGLLHGLDFVFASFLLGGLVFETCIVPAGGAAALALIPRKQRQLIGVAFFALLSSITWFVYLAADMAGSWSISDLREVLFQTDFGHIWMLKVLLLISILGALRFGALRWAAVSSLALPVFFSLTGHANARETGWATSLALDSVHFFSVSVWTGGLLGLFLWLGKRRREIAKAGASDISHRVVHRFSRFAMVSTALIVLTGVGMAYLYGVAPRAPWETHYGRVLLLKVGLFALALAAASINQFIHLGKWSVESEGSFVQGVHREVGIEILLVLGAFLVAGFLTRSALPGL